MSIPKRINLITHLITAFCLLRLTNPAAAQQPRLRPVTALLGAFGAESP